VLLGCNNLAYGIIKVMDKQYFVKLAGSQRKLAELLGIKQPAVGAWKQVPKARIWQLKVLRPDWFKEQT
jgi:hypothetical protein